MVQKSYKHYYDHTDRGFEWMARNAELGMGSIIADDMGLGKTLQVITLLLHFKIRDIFPKIKHW